MLKRRITLAMLMLAVPMVAQAETPAPVTAKPEEVGLSSARLQKIQAATEQNIKDGLIPGAVMVVARRGKIAWVSVQGRQTADSDAPMKYDSIFRIYSMTKPLTSITLMQLVEEGRVQVTDPVEKYLPELGKMKVGTEVVVEGKPTLHLSDPDRPVTVQDLLRHTSG
jgi:CubicO group peptidase (beta-lactamase class C family)